MKDVSIYLHAGAYPNPGTAAIASLHAYTDAQGREHTKTHSGFDGPPLTNNAALLAGLTDALAQLKEPCHVTVVTCSEYLARGINDGYPAPPWAVYKRAAAAHTVHAEWVRKRDATGHARAVFDEVDRLVRELQHG